MGEGDVCGDVMRGFEGVLTAREFDIWFCCGTAFATRGDPSGRAPN